jgi:glycosyltransferase involved in cell wall biosynthesis
MTRATVVTPTYQHAAFIEYCIGSVLAQTMSDWEMIIVDDGSTDGTADIAESIRDPRITVIRRAHRGIKALGSAYDLALAHATSPFIAVLEGDDAWPRTKLEDQLPLFDDPDVVLTFGPAGLMDQFGCVYARSSHCPSGRIARNEPVGSILPALADLNFLISPTVMLRRETLVATGGFLQPDGVPYVDHPTWLRLATAGKFARCPKIVGYRRCHPEQWTTTSLLEPAVNQTAYIQAITDQAGGRLGPDVLAPLHRTIERGPASQVEVQAVRQARLALLEGRWSQSIMVWRRLLHAQQPTVRALAMLGVIAAIVRTDVEWVFRIMGLQPWPSRRHQAKHHRRELLANGDCGKAGSADSPFRVEQQTRGTVAPARPRATSPGDGVGPVPARLPLSVVIPVRNAESFIEECLASVVAAAPAEIIVVDGCSTDRTLDIVGGYGVRVLSDGGGGVATARMMGVHEARSEFIALIDADIVLPDGALAALLTEFRSGGYSALQAGLHSTSGPGYYGRALARHHNTGRSRNWLGVMATIFLRETLLAYPLDASFLSGEDIDLRWRLSRAGVRMGVSRKTVVSHRFGDTLEFARGQWRADGAGLGRMALTHSGGGLLLLMPLADVVRGVTVTTLRLEPQYVPYYLMHAVFNYSSMISILWAAVTDRRQRRRKAR